MLQSRLWLPYIVGCHELLANIPSTGVITVNREVSMSQLPSLGVEVKSMKPLAV